MWDPEYNGLLGLMEAWSQKMQKNPENSNSFIATEIDGLKRDIAQFYFDHESSDSPYGPYYWFENFIRIPIFKERSL